jgi:hypothetical protein
MMTLSIVMLTVILLSVAFSYSYAEFQHVQSRYAECRYAECHCAHFSAMEQIVHSNKTVQLPKEKKQKLQLLDLARKAIKLI